MKHFMRLFLSLLIAAAAILILATGFSMADGPLIGEVRMYAGAQYDATPPVPIPTGWLLADGSCYSQTTYPELYAVIVGDEITDTFCVPDFRYRFPLGASPDQGIDVGSTGGEISHTLTILEIPSHLHNIPQLRRYDGDYGGGADYPRPEAGAISAYNSSYSANTLWTGGGNAHNTMPPYSALSFIIAYTTSVTPTPTPVPDVDFPSTGILDDFDRGDEGPPLGPGWSNTPRTTWVSESYLTGDDIIPSLWKTDFGDDNEVRASLHEAYPSGHSLILFSRYTLYAGTGYVLDVWTGGGFHFLRLYTFDGETVDLLDISDGIVVAPDDEFGLKVVGTNITGYYRPAGGGAWIEVVSAIDATYDSGGLVGIAIVNQSLISNFYGGTATEEAFPESTLLDDFDREDEGKYVSDPTNNWHSSVVHFLHNNEAEQTSPKSYWNESDWGDEQGPDIEWYAEVSYLPDNESSFVLAARYDGIDLEDSSCALIVLHAIGGDSVSLIGEDPIVIDLQAGDWFGLRCVGATITGYYKSVGGDWSEFDSMTTEVIDSGMLAIISAGGVRFGSFGGGDFAPVTPTPTPTPTSTIFLPLVYSHTLDTGTVLYEPAQVSFGQIIIATVGLGIIGSNLFLFGIVRRRRYS